MTGVNMDKKYSAIIKEYYNEVREAYEVFFLMNLAVVYVQHVAHQLEGEKT